MGHGDENRTIDSETLREPMTTIYDAYHIVTESDRYGVHISAVTDSGDIEIVGANCPATIDDWRIYVSRLIPQRTGLPQPCRLHAPSQIEARHWVETLAWLYTHTGGQS